MALKATGWRWKKGNRYSPFWRMTQKTHLCDMLSWTPLLGWIVASNSPNVHLPGNPFASPRRRASSGTAGKQFLSATGLLGSPASLEGSGSSETEATCAHQPPSSTFPRPDPDPPTRRSYGSVLSPAPRLRRPALMSRPADELRDAGPETAPLPGRRPSAAPPRPAAALKQRF